MLNFFKKDLQYIIFVIASVALPLTKTYLPYIMFLWVLSGLFCIRKINLAKFKNKILIIFPFIFYLLFALGLFYSNNINKGLFDLEVKLSVLFIPLIIIFISDKALAYDKILIKLFIFSNFIASIVCLVYAFSQSIQIDDNLGIIFETSVWPEVFKEYYSPLQLIVNRYSYFSYNYLSVFHHPTYYSVYLLFSVVSLVFLIRKSSKRNIGYYILIGYFTLILLLLGSRAVLITYFICFIFYLTTNNKAYKVGILITLLAIAMMLVIFSNDKIENRLSRSFNIINGEALSKKSDMRLWLWKSGLEVFKENFWFGVGTGDIDVELKKKYEKYDLKLASEHNYNVHNQFLDIAIKFGIFGLIIFTSWMVYALMISIKRKQFLFFFFLLIMLVNFNFEIMLNSIAGVSFFAFFYSLLYAKYNIIQEIHVNKKT